MTSYPPLIKRPSTPSHLHRPSDSKNSLLADASRIYQEKIRDPKRITPYENGAFPKLPSVTNIFSVPSDTYSATKSLIGSIKNRDGEGVQDSVISLIEVPIVIGSSVGSAFDYGIGLHIIPKTLSFLLKPAYVFSLLLCLIEGIVDSFGLARQKSFGDEFDFELLKNLKILTDNTSVADGQKAFEALAQYAKENSDMIQQLCGKEDTKKLLSFTDDLQKEIKKNPHFSKFIFAENQTQIRDLAKVVLAKNILHLQEEYLQLNPNEVEKIAQKVEKNYSDLPVEKQREKLIKQLDKELNKKRKSLSRRVRPWMVHEASDTAHSILMGLTSSVKKNQELAIDEGLKLMDDMRIQNVKKTLVHVIGIIAMVVAIASLIALLAGAPYAVPLVLITIATIIGAGRFAVFLGTLDVRGWDFSFKNLLPTFIRRRIWDDQLLCDPEMLSKRKVTPLTEIYDPPISSALR
ncbi:hypothetical protein [Simkania sp.]|uniref:hypothetical protein n=1 Tax=Simkania sp. TaxID=34094 RepID=UPI003B516949